MSTDPQTLSGALRIGSSRARCLWDIGRQELSVLPYAHEAEEGALIAVVRTFSTDPRPGIVINDTHEPAFCLKDPDGDDRLLDYSQLDPDMRRLAGPIDTAQRTDPHLRAWAEMRIKARCPNMEEDDATVEVFSLRDAAVLHDIDYLRTPPGLSASAMAADILNRIDVAFPHTLSHHALITAMRGVQAVISGIIYAHVGQEFGLSPEETQVVLDPPA